MLQKRQPQFYRMGHAVSVGQAQQFFQPIHKAVVPQSTIQVEGGRGAVVQISFVFKGKRSVQVGMPESRLCFLTLQQGGTKLRQQGCQLIFQAKTFV